MIKLMNTAIFMFASVVMFAQRQREGRFPANDSPEDQFATSGGLPTTPVDQYMYLLIAVAVVMIAYVIYRRIQLHKAV